MSLKAFHLVFVTALTSLSLGCSVWKFIAFGDAHRATDLIWAIVALLCAFGVLIYGKYFLKKLKNVSFL